MQIDDKLIGPKATHPIARPWPGYARCMEQWQLVHDLRGGTLRMREVAKKFHRWLAPEGGEAEADFEQRVDRSFLHEAYVDAIDDLLSKPFSKPIEVKGALPEQIADIPDDCDLQGTSLTEFGKRYWRDSLDHGTSYLLVDFPSVGGQQSEGQERDNRIRPYFVHLTAENVIGFTESKGPNGRNRLTSIRWIEVESLPGEYGMEEALRIRRMSFVYQDEIDAAGVAGFPAPRGVVERWGLVKKSDGAGEEWALVEPATTHTFVGLPLVDLPLNPCGRMEAKPVLGKLAWLNCKHWQESSDQSNNLRFARIGILLATGVTAEEGKSKKLVIGPNSLVRLQDPNADLKYVTGGTEGITAGRQSLVDLEAAMEALGAAPMLQRRPGDQAGTSAAIAEGDANSDLEAWARQLEHALRRALEIAAEWIKKPLPESVEVDVFTEFTIPFAQSQDLATLIQLHAVGALSKVDLLSEFQRRKALDKNMDVKAAVARAEQEDASLADVGMGDTPPTDPPPEDPEGDPAGDPPADAKDKQKPPPAKAA